MPNALILDDDDSIRRAVVEIVEQSGFEAIPAGSIAEARKIITSRPLDLALLDLELPDGSGLDLLPELDELPQMDVIVISGKATVDITVEAFRSGVVDLMTKPVDPGRLRESLAKARKSALLHEEIHRLRGQLRSLGRFGPMVGASPAMQKVYDLIGKVAPTNSTVLIVGETGTGKELVARAVHELSKRSDGPYLPVNCGAIQPNLIESELFGHEKGAFTGADKRRHGLFEQAEGGTLFLDEITEMPIELQVKLLRVLETGEFRRVGGDRDLTAQARILAATNRDPDRAVADEVLREDLMYRLSVFPIPVPPLRERGSDVRLLAQAFLQKANRDNETKKRFAPEFFEQLESRDWPGNVRELKNFVDRAYILADEEIGAAEDRAPAATPAKGTPDGDGVDDALRMRVGQSIAEVERALIEATMAETDNKKQAAEMLGISVKTLYVRLNRYAERGGS